MRGVPVTFAAEITGKPPKIENIAGGKCNRAPGHALILMVLSKLD
jgi:hypothetical protein